MKHAFLPAILAISAIATPLRANDPNIGFALTLGFPTGQYSSYTYERLFKNNDTGQTAILHVTDSYDPGIGGQFWLSFPLDQQVAIRMNFGGMITNGSSVSNVDRRNLRHQIWNLGADMQFFTENAFRHRGTYFLAGVSADFERFEESKWDIPTAYPWEIETRRKNRMGGNFGIGHSFPFSSGLKFTMEGVYHKTLTGTDDRQFSNSDFIRTNFGLVF